MDIRQVIKSIGGTAIATVGVSGIAAADCFDNKRTDSDSTTLYTRDWDAELNSDLTTYQCGSTTGCDGQRLNVYTTSKGTVYGVGPYDDGTAGYLKLTSTLTFHGQGVTFENEYPQYSYSSDSITATYERNDASEIQHGFGGIEVCVNNYDKTTLEDQLEIHKEGRKELIQTSCTIDPGWI